MLFHVIITWIGNPGNVQILLDYQTDTQEHFIQWCISKIKEKVVKINLLISSSAKCSGVFIVLSPSEKHTKTFLGWGWIANGFDLTPHFLSFSSAGTVTFPDRFVNLPWLWTSAATRLSSAHMDDFDRGEPRRNALPFKLTAHDAKRIRMPASLLACLTDTACKRQENCSPLSIRGIAAPRWSPSTVLQLHIVRLMRLGTSWWCFIINNSPVNTSCADLQMSSLKTASVECAAPLIRTILFHLGSGINVTCAHQIY